MSQFRVQTVHYASELFSDLLAEADASDGRFMIRLRDRWLDGSERFDRPGEILLGAFAGEKLIGVAGISHDPYEPEDGLGRVRHVYVLASYRRRGIARILLRQVIAHSRNHFAVLRLRTSNEVAARLYEDLGFVSSTKGRESHRLRVDASPKRA